MLIRFGGFEVEIGFNGVVPVDLFISAARLGSVFVERRREWVGFGIEGGRAGNRTIFAGHVEATCSNHRANVAA